MKGVSIITDAAIVSTVVTYRSREDIINSILTHDEIQDGL